MTEREREYADLGVEYAEGIEQCDSGTVYLAGKLFHFEKTIDYNDDDEEIEVYEGWFNGQDDEITTATTLTELFKQA